MHQNNMGITFLGNFCGGACTIQVVPEHRQLTLKYVYWLLRWWNSVF